MTKKKHAKAPSVQENYYVCAPCGKECSGETSLLQHCLGQEHFRRVGHRGFAGCIPNKLGQIPPLSDEFFVRIAQGPAGLEQVPPEGPMSENDPLTQQPAGGLGGGCGSSGFDGAAPTTAAFAAQTDKFFQTLYRCAACGTTVSGHISFVEHCRGKAHIKKAGFSGFAGLLPNDAGIIPPVPPQLLASMPAAQPAMPDFAVAAAAAAAALVAAGDSGVAAPGAAPAVAAAPAVPPPVKEKKAVSVRMNQASLAALSQAARNHDREKITGKGPSAGERAAEKAAKAAARALERNKHGGNRAGPVPQLEVPFGPFAADRAKLPIANFRETVLQTMRANQVTVLQGDTGCGKTTQVPQFILEEAAAAGTHISIVCTQPRRISAMGVAERVAQERGEAVSSSPTLFPPLACPCSPAPRPSVPCCPSAMPPTASSCPPAVSHMLLSLSAPQPALVRAARSDGGLCHPAGEQVLLGDASALLYDRDPAAPSRGGPHTAGHHPRRRGRSSRAVRRV